MTGPSQSSFLHLSEEELRGRVPAWFGADVKCFYDHLVLRAWIYRFFMSENVSAEEFCRWLTAEWGVLIVPPPSAHVYVCMRVVTTSRYDAWACCAGWRALSCSRR